MRAMQRKITFEEIIECITNPDSSTEKKDSIVCYKKLGWNSVLLVYTKDEKDNIIVVTVIKTSQIKKYFP